MTLNENTIRELLEQATPGPWKYKLEEGCRMSDLVETLTGWIQTEDGETVLGTGLEINDDQELQNLTLAALAPELAAEVLRLHEALKKQLDEINLVIALADVIQPQTEAQQTATTLARDLCDDLTRILNGDTNE